MLKACLFAIEEYFTEHNVRLPVMVSGTIFENGRTLSAQTVEAFWASVSHFDMISVGLNCAVGVELMRAPIESLSQIARKPVSCYPNAGMPDGFGGFTGTKEGMAAALGEFARNGWVNIVGGCCGTTPEWIARHRRGRRGCPAPACPGCPSMVDSSGTEALTVRPETNFVMVGERTNITGSRKFARLIKAATSRLPWPWPASRSKAAPTSSTSTWTRPDRRRRRR